jgi:hypothetical protein
LLLTFGAALVLEEAIRIVWGPGERHLPFRTRSTVPSSSATSSTRSTASSRLRGSRLDVSRLVVPRKDALRCASEGGRTRQRDGARARHRHRAIALFVFAFGPRSPPRLVSCSRRSGDCGLTSVSTR